MMIESVLVLAVVAFICEYVDATVGMGFGTILTPALIILGYEPITLVPVVLFAQFFAGFVCSAFHHRFRNMNILDDKEERYSLYIFGMTGVVGILLSTFSVITFPAFFVKMYITLAVMAMGIIMMFTRNREISYSKEKLALMGTVAAFNKGISGGGYGAIAVGGQIVSDIKPRAAVAITTLVEGMLCAIGFLIHFLVRGFPSLLFIIPITVGGVLAAPFSALTVAKLDDQHVKGIIAICTFIVGLVTLLWVLTGGFF
ncbi:MAG: TSUP family transporter [Candidatus Lokiarchaeota archaeon]|nr:TSUP family transporter [Candidatus Lokiarchaeota archaeon]